MHRIFSFLFPDIAKSIGVLLAKAVVIACFQLISILPANATEPPVCTGKNLLAEMERSDPIDSVSAAPVACGSGR